MSDYCRWWFLDVLDIYTLCISGDLAEDDQRGVQHWHGQGAHGQHQGVQGKAGCKMYDKKVIEAP